jgi:cytochrome oxidase Cu insertion factor (SCO1/SenC/PrrC family)
MEVYSRNHLPEARSMRSLVLAALIAPLTASLAAQQPAASQDPRPLEVGVVAPDFTLPGATRYGVLKDPIHLSDFKGKTVVLAFFFKARTRG